MSRLLALLDRLRPAFEAGPLRWLRPSFGAADAFLFSVDARTDAAPHVRGPNNVRRRMAGFALAALPCLAAAIYFFGWRVLATTAVTCAVGMLIQLTFAGVRKGPKMGTGSDSARCSPNRCQSPFSPQVREGFILTGLLYPLILPPALPLGLVAVGIAFGLVVGRELLGAAGRRGLNPALLGLCFLQAAYPAAMTAGWVRPAAGWPGGLACWLTSAPLGPAGPRVAGAVSLGPLGAPLDAATSATPLADAKLHGHFADGSAMLLGNHPGAAGETSALLIILAGVFLVLAGLANWRIIAATLGSFAVLLAFVAWARPGIFTEVWLDLAAANPTHTVCRFGADPTIAEHVAWHLQAGGLLFGTVFLATDPVTSPASNLGKWLYGSLIGGTTVLLRFLAGHTEGVALAILLGSFAAPALDALAARMHIWRLRHEG
jgi:Na+-transporting NADH:ubiquinone oxidoreductase subunit NqrB